MVFMFFVKLLLIFMGFAWMAIFVIRKISGKDDQGLIKAIQVFFATGGIVLLIAAVEFYVALNK